jgi:hypothetical protein
MDWLGGTQDFKNRECYSYALYVIHIYFKGLSLLTISLFCSTAKPLTPKEGMV